MKLVLIIEDDPIITLIYRTRLEIEGYSVETCNDGQSGFDRVQEISPDAILLDLMLPGMNGLEFLRQIRADVKFASVPVLVFTNAYLANMIQEATAAGASQIYNKATLRPKQLLECLHVLMYGTSRPTSISTVDPCAVIEPATLVSLPLQEHPGSPPPPANHGYNPDNYGGSTTADPPARSSVTDPDQELLDSDVCKEFLASRAEIFPELRTVLQKFIKAQDEKEREPHLLNLYRLVRALTARAGLASFGDIAQISSALEVLLKDLHEQPRHLNASTFRTVAQSVEFIGELLNVCQPRGGDLPPPKILVVDDEVLSRRAIVHALQRGNLKSIGVEDPLVALRMVTEEPFDLILLDIQMPSMDGFELCRKIRSLPANETTPVLFVTRLTDFKNRAKSTMSGGTDFIAKPFLFIEVTIKAISLVLRKRLLAKAKAA